MDPRRDPNLGLLHDPRFYDAMYPSAGSNELAFWRELASGGQPILEVGCGTGRLLLPLLEAGHAVHGLDLASAMLERLEQKLRVRGLRSTLYLADARNFEVETHYQQVFWPFNGLAQLTTIDDLHACIRQVAAALTPGGRFAFDLTNPDREVLLTAPHTWAEFKDPEGGGWVRVEDVPNFDPDTRIKTHHLSYRFEASHELRTQTLRLRQHTRAELETLLLCEGFEIEAEYGDYDQSPRDDESFSFIVLARYSP